MTPQQRIRWLILEKARSVGLELPEITAANVDKEYDDRAYKVSAMLDAREEVRTGGENTGLPCEFSRNYESDAVAMQCPDGKWVGWTYWYGGGKHGDPGSIPWIEDAYDVTATEEQKMVPVRTFAKASA